MSNSRFFWFKVKTQKFTLQKLKKSLYERKPLKKASKPLKSHDNVTHAPHVYQVPFQKL